MYTDQHTPWKPKAIVIGEEPTLVDEMCVASLLCPEEFISYDLDLLRGTRNLSAWYILKMMDRLPSS